MKKRIYNFFHGELLSSICFLLIGLAIFFFPTESINIICKVVFSLVLIAAGLYYLIRYISEKKDTTMLDLFTGVIVFVIGWFLFENPQIAVKLMPRLLGAMVIVDTAWILRAAKYFKKQGKEAWKAFLVDSLIFIAAGVAVMIAPFKVISQNMIFAGCVFVANGIADIVFYIMNAKRIRDAAKGTENPEEKKNTKDEEFSKHFDDLEDYEEYDPSYAEKLAETEHSEEDKSSEEKESLEQSKPEEDSENASEQKHRIISLPMKEDIAEAEEPEETDDSILEGEWHEE